MRANRIAAKLEPYQERLLINELIKKKISNGNDAVLILCLTFSETLCLLYVNLATCNDTCAIPISCKTVFETLFVVSTSPPAMTLMRLISFVTLFETLCLVYVNLTNCNGTRRLILSYYISNKFKYNNKCNIHTQKHQLCYN